MKKYHKQRNLFYLKPSLKLDKAYNFNFKYPKLSVLSHITTNQEDQQNLDHAIFQGSYENFYIF